MGNTFIAVFSSQVKDPERDQILAQALKTWPFVRMPRHDVHFQNSAHFSSQNYGDYRFDNEDDRRRAADDAASLQRDLPEWSQKFPKVKFVLIVFDDNEECRTGGFVCSNGQVTLTRELKDEPHSDELFKQIYLLTHRYDPLAPGYFCNLKDLTQIAFAELDVVRQYLQIMNQSLIKEWESYEAAARDHMSPEAVDELQFPYEYWDSMSISVEDERIWYKTTLTQELRRSVFVSSYSLLEQNLKHICNYVERVKDRIPNLAGKSYSKTADLGILKAKNYLEPIASSCFNSNRNWQRILEYKSIRNVIVHSGREIASREDFRELAPVANRRRDFNIDDDLLELSDTFCETCVTDMQALFHELAKELPKV